MKFDCLKEVAEHIRNRLKNKNIKARVKMNRNGLGSIIISAPAYGVNFSDADQAFMVQLAKGLNMGGVRGLLLSTAPYGAEFWLTSEGIAEWRRQCERFPHGPACCPAH